MAEQIVTVDCRDGIAKVQLNRPEKHNSLTFEMFEAIGAAGQQVAADASARVVVLSGNGPSFCAGLDFSLMRALLSNEPSAQAVAQGLLAQGDGPENLAQRVAYQWKALEVPVIAAIQGAAFGGGFQIAMGCDLRVAAPSARFSIMEMRYGLIPDMSITQTLPDLIAQDVALELSLTAREFDAVEAKELGLITQLDAQPLESAMALAATIASRSPDAVRACKRLYNTAWRTDAASGLALEASLQRGLIGGKNQREAVAASLEKRAPTFVDA